MVVRKLAAAACLSVAATALLPTAASAAETGGSGAEAVCQASPGMTRRRPESAKGGGQQPVAVGGRGGAAGQAEGSRLPPHGTGLVVRADGGQLAAAAQFDAQPHGGVGGPLGNR